MTIKVGINGFGRIGRNFFRAVQASQADIEIVAVNDLGSIKTMAHLLKYDSVLGVLPNKITALEDGISVDGKVLKVLQVRDPKELPWKALGVDLVIESTGIFTDRDKAAMHLDAGAPLVIVSAPSNGADATIVYGVNHDDFQAGVHKVISNASCTTNCFVPLVKVLDDAFGVEGGLMTTIHAYTGDQALVDGPHSDLRRARGAAINIIPSSTGAAKAVGKVIPALNGKLTGMSFRVPTVDVSVVDLTVKLAKETSYEEIMKVLKSASENEMKGVLGFTEDDVVSQDFVSDTRTSIVDAKAGIGLNSTFFKLVSWYDNEYGYSSKLIDLSVHIAGLK